MNSNIDREFAEALRATLLEQARPQRAAARRGYRRTTFIGLGTVVGLGVMGAAAAAVFGFPGGEVEKSLSSPVELTGVSRASLLLGEAPKGANAVHFEFECTSPGTYVMSDAGIVLTCDKDDLDGSRVSGLVSATLVTDGSVAVSSDRVGKWTLRAWYVETTRTPLATNAAGETFGVDSEDASPDLILTEADNGRPGYLRRSDVEAAERREPTSPDKVANHEPREFKLPVYESDGKTRVGSVVWGG